MYLRSAALSVILTSTTNSRRHLYKLEGQSIAHDCQAWVQLGAACEPQQATRALLLITIRTLPAFAVCRSHLFFYLQLYSFAPRPYADPHGKSSAHALHIKVLYLPIVFQYSEQVNYDGVELKRMEDAVVMIVMVSKTHCDGLTSKFTKLASWLFQRYSSYVTKTPIMKINIALAIVFQCDMHLDSPILDGASKMRLEAST